MRTNHKLPLQPVVHVLSDLLQEAMVMRMLMILSASLVLPMYYKNTKYKPDIFTRQFHGKQHPTLPTELPCQYCQHNARIINYWIRTENMCGGV